MGGPTVASSTPADPAPTSTPNPTHTLLGEPGGQKDRDDDLAGSGVQVPHIVQNALSNMMDNWTMKQKKAPTSDLPAPVAAAAAAPSPIAPGLAAAPVPARTAAHASPATSAASGTGLSPTDGAAAVPANAEEQRRLRRARRHMYIEPMPVLSARAQQAAAAQYDQVAAGTLCVTCCMQSKCWLGVPLQLSGLYTMMRHVSPRIHCKHSFCRLGLQRWMQIGQHAQAGLVLQYGVQLAGSDAARALAKARAKCEHLKQASLQRYCKEERHRESAKEELQQNMPMHQRARNGRMLILT